MPPVIEIILIDWCYCCFALLNFHLTAAHARPVRPIPSTAMVAGSGNFSYFYRQ